MQLTLTTEEAALLNGIVLGHLDWLHWQSHEPDDQEVRRVNNLARTIAAAIERDSRPRVP